MFPVYDTLTGTGVNALYHVIAWVGFRVDSFECAGQQRLDQRRVHLDHVGGAAGDGSPTPSRTSASASSTLIH